MSPVVTAPTVSLAPSCERVFPGPRKGESPRRSGDPVHGSAPKAFPRRAAARLAGVHSGQGADLRVRVPGVPEPVRPAAAARGCGSELSRLRRHERAEAGLGLRGRVEGIPGTPPRAFHRLRVRWRLQLSGLRPARLSCGRSPSMPGGNSPTVAAGGSEPSGCPEGSRCPAASVPRRPGDAGSPGPS